MLLQMRDVDSGLLSNTIMLQLEPPPQIVDTPPVSGYLYLESATRYPRSAASNVNRLGGAPLPRVAVLREQVLTKEIITCQRNRLSTPPDTARFNSRAAAFYRLAKFCRCRANAGDQPSKGSYAY
jgi:hypothetical protein